MARAMTNSPLVPTIWVLTVLGLYAVGASQMTHAPRLRPPADANSAEVVPNAAHLADAGRSAPAPSGEPAAAAPADTPLARGQSLFAKQCAICHGAAGDGAGPFAYLMNPRPRNFKAGQFKLGTTQNQIPSDEDLLRTISRGMPGSAMPPWGHLPSADLKAVVAYVRSIHGDAVRAELEAGVKAGEVRGDEVAGLLQERTTPGAPIVVPPEPKADEVRWFNGRRIYLESCASCHGADGHPLAEAVKFDAEGYPDPPRSFVNGIFKGGMDGPDLYCRIMKGMRGTPMPASEGNYAADDVWDLIHYVQSLARAGSQERAQLRQGTLIAPNIVGALPSGPKDAAWGQARPLYVALTPLWWTEERIEGLVVQALHNDRELALRLSWIDATGDDRAVRVEEFRDAVAIQFSLSSDPPFYMGDRSRHGGVNIWMWKADRQKNIAAGYQDVDAAFPNRVVDMYDECPIRGKNPPSPPLEKGGNGGVYSAGGGGPDWPHGIITEHHARFITAWGAGNLVADPQLKTPVECLTARGPGTLSGKPANVQIVQGQAVYERGVWMVQMQRALELPHDHGANGEPDERLFKPGDYLPVSFAIWNGSAGDRDGKKNISIWQKLVIE